MLINHETPLDLLETSLTFNDYEFVLPMFYEKYPQYKDFILKCKEKGRFSILDCGLFEGIVPSDEKLIELINEVKPSIFVVPDVWNNSYQTLINATNWKKIKSEGRIPIETKLMVVLQGKSYWEISTLLWNVITMEYDCIGLNHSSLAYSEIYPHPNPSISKTMGRIEVFNRLIEEDIFNRLSKCHIHLLGINIPSELIYINHKELITSIDTSNPIINGIKGIRYDGLTLDKPEEKLEVFMENDTKYNIDNILYNVGVFRKWSL